MIPSRATLEEYVALLTCPFDAFQLVWDEDRRDWWCDQCDNSWLDLPATPATAVDHTRAAGGEST